MLAQFRGGLLTKVITLALDAGIAAAG